MIDIANDNLDNELNIEKFMNIKNNPRQLEYWRKVFPTKTDIELEEYRVRWSKENPKYLKFERL